MDMIVTFALLVLGTMLALAGFGEAALHWGVDSRVAILDDHTR